MLKPVAGRLVLKPKEKRRFDDKNDADHSGDGEEAVGDLDSANSPQQCQNERPGDLDLQQRRNERRRYDAGNHHCRQITQRHRIRAVVVREKLGIAKCILNTAHHNTTASPPLTYNAARSTWGTFQIRRGNEFQNVEQQQQQNLTCVALSMAREKSATFSLGETFFHSP